MTLKILQFDKFTTHKLMEVTIDKNKWKQDFFLSEGGKIKLSNLIKVITLFVTFKIEKSTLGNVKRCKLKSRSDKISNN